MNPVNGWLLDVYVDGERAVIWIRTIEGETLRLIDSYRPFLYVEPVDRAAEQGLLYMLTEAGCTVEVEAKSTALGSSARKRLLRVEAPPHLFKGILNGLRRSRLVRGLYDSDLLDVQRYLFTKLKVEPTSKVSVEYRDGRLLSMRKLDDHDELAPPQFRTLVVKGIHVEGRDMEVDARAAGVEKRFNGDREAALASFAELVADADPDLIIFNSRRDEFKVDRQLLKLGRCSADGAQLREQGSIAGRVVLGGVLYGFSADEWGTAGLVERTRFSFVPMGLATRWLSNKSIDSRNCFELMSRGYAIPEEGYFEYARSLMSLLERDRGGVTFTPLHGLHENVASLDFDSQYPSLIMKGGLSYEPESDDLFRLIPTVMGPWLSRRLLFKGMKRSLKRGSPERIYCEERISTLKYILVSQYGIAGCASNRFGNIVTFEEINRMSREAIIRAKGIAESHDFTIVYGDVDSLFVKKDGAKREDYETLAATIAAETGLPMSLDNHFRFLSFLPLKSDENTSALKKYFGVTTDGEVVARGIELRRSDVPLFIRKFQEGLVALILDRSALGDIYGAGMRDGLRFIESNLRMIGGGDLPVESLAIKRRLKKRLSAYVHNTAQRVAAAQLSSLGREIGDEISFIYVNGDSADPHERVKPIELAEKGGYDADRYRTLLLEAAGTIYRGLGTKFDSKSMTLDEFG
ncbi:MAG: hypothetical protein JRM78_03500 [Nitrososphaerota archaeon]|nr:hypothetical protein [Nitrososphaerota archaeon]